MSLVVLWWLLVVISGLLVVNVLLQSYVVYLKRTTPPVGVAETLADVAEILRIVQANQRQAFVEQKVIADSVKQIPQQTAAIVQADVVQATEKAAASLSGTKHTPPPGVGE